MCDIVRCGYHDDITLSWSFVASYFSVKVTGMQTDSESVCMPVTTHYEPAECQSDSRCWAPLVEPGHGFLSFELLTGPAAASGPKRGFSPWSG